MKKLTLFLAILMATTLVKGQSYTYDSIVGIDLGFYSFNVNSLLELRDGNILSHSPFWIPDESGFSIISDLGHMLVKVSSDACFLDSLLMENDYASYCLLERNPHGRGNLFVKIDRDLENCQTNLLIRHIDDQLYYDEASDIIVPLEDTIVSGWEKYLFEDDENIILFYILTSGQTYTPIMVRAGLDGTIKDRVELPDNIMNIMSETAVGGNNLMVYNDSPREYAWTNSSRSVFGYFVVDSLFQLKEYIRVEEEFEPGYLMERSGEQMLSLDENSYLVTTRYYTKLHYGNNGVRITKYDKTTHTNIGTVKFATDPQGPDHGFVTCAIPCDLKKSADGNLYFVYQTADPFAPSGFYVCVAKLDYDLNVLWQRYCLDPGFDHTPDMILSLENGGCVVGGFEKGHMVGHISPKMFYLFFHDDGVGTPETETFVRPYMFYPNPIQSELHLRYSPDVTPTQIELYDLQGQLVCMQKNSLERLEMSGLPSGTYTMRVMLEDGKVFSDKVVKE